MKTRRRLLDAIAAGSHLRCLLPLIPLMRGGGEPGNIETMERNREHGTRSEVTIGLRHSRKDVSRLMDYADAWLQALKEWNVIESPVWKEIRTEGALETRRSDLVRGIELRFQTPLPAELRTAIDNSTDLAELLRWLEAMFSAPTLEAYRRCHRPVNANYPLPTGFIVMALTTEQIEQQRKQAEELLFSGPQTLGFAKGLFFGHFNAPLLFPYPELNSRRSADRRAGRCRGAPLLPTSTSTPPPSTATPRFPPASSTASGNSACWA